ncbi:MAG: hypothetical protein WC804_15175 [Sphingomonas sp.]|jgi:hypothetical protein|uniref:hypothetical protein n=1 Tax=Sphingomonas sp. TaxID=28214 RepID=UPI003567C370
MAVIVFALWIGSAVAGWFLFWPWLVVPLAVFGLHIMRMSARMRAARERNGLPVSGPLGTSMTGANVQLLAVTLVQHAVIFAVAAGVHGLFR